MVENFQIEDMVEQTQRTVSYKAYNIQSGRKVLLKRYLVDDSSGLGRIDDWQSEFTQLVERFSHLDHPSLHSLIGGGVDPQDGSPYVVFEWIDMSSLSKIMSGQSLSEKLVVAMAKSSLAGLKFLNDSGVIHAGISPQSISYTDADNKKPWFLLWCPVRAMSHKHGFGRSGLDVYSAPEVLDGDATSETTDVYALGRTIEKALSGEEDNSLAPWLANLTEIEPANRCKNAGDAILSLEQSIANASKKTTTRVFLKTNSVAPTSAETNKNVAAQKAVNQSGAAVSVKSASKSVSSKVATKRTSLSQSATKAQSVKKRENKKVVIFSLLGALLLLGLAFFFITLSMNGDTNTSQTAQKKGSSSLSVDDLADTVLKPSDVPLIKDIKGSRYVFLEGKVSDVGESKSGKTLMMNFVGSNKSNKSDFLSVWIPRKIHLSEQTITTIQSEFVDKTIRVKGRLNFSQITNTHYVKLVSAKDMKILPR